MSAEVVALGWTLFLSAWLSILLAMLVWTLIRSARASAPAMRHDLAMGGLTLVLVAAAGTVVWLVGRPAPTSREGVIHLQTDRSAPVRPLHAPPMLASTREVGAALTSIVPVRLVAWGGLVWVAATSLLGIRALGGMLVVLRLRRRSTPLHSAVLRERVERLAEGMGLQQPIALLESSEIDAPVALGLWRAALIFPRDLETNLERHHIEPLVAHELEHVRQHDPFFAAVQAGIDAVLCLCPGAHWLSAQARTARELRCDDAAVRLCGDRAVYASALGALASLGCCGGPSPALGVSGISLVERIRRILKGDAMPRLTFVQVTGAVLGLVTLGWSGPVLWGAALEQTRTAEERKVDGGDTTGATTERPPFVAGWRPQPGDSPVRLVDVKGNADYACETIRIRNTSESAITSVRLVAVVEYAPLDRPVELIESESVPVSLQPGEALDLDLHFLSTQQAEQMRRMGRAQAMLAISATRDADGTEWRLTPRRDARSAAEAFYTKNDAFVSRSLIKSTAPATTTVGFCLDDRGHTYSQGAIVPILGENRFARCSGGTWIDIGTLGKPEAPPQG